jgi:putative acetyltransferase
VLVRRERSADVDAVRSVHLAAFGRGGEARLVDELRGSDAWIGSLSLVACVGGVVAGHVVCSRATAGGDPVVGLGPLGVLPEFQRAGVGKALVHTVLGAADALGEPLVGLLGDPLYYSRFGFVPADEVGISPTVAEWVPYFQVRPLSAYDPLVRGTFVYAPSFDGV